MKALFFLFSAGEKVKVINSADEHWWEVCVFFYFSFFLFFFSTNFASARAVNKILRGL